MLVRVGTLPVSVLNIGLSSASLTLTAEVTKLTAEIVDLAPAAAAMVALEATPPDPLALVPSLEGHVAGAVANINPLVLGPLNAELDVELTAKLGALGLQIAAAKEITASIGAGVAAGGIAGWSYAGRGAGLGSKLATVLPAGFGDVRGDATVGALVVASESFSAWGNFSAGFHTGGQPNLGPTTVREDLAFLGALAGGEWNSGVARLKARLDLFLDLLEGEAANLALQLQYALGLTIPNVQALLDVVLNFDIEGAFAALVSVDVDITAAIGAIQAKIDAALALKAALDAQLSGGGLTLWVYSGSLAGLGTAMQAELTQGLPGGSGPRTPVYGLALACASPSAWSDFGLIFKNAA